MHIDDRIKQTLYHAVKHYDKTVKDNYVRMLKKVMLEEIEKLPQDFDTRNIHDIRKLLEDKQ